MFKRTIFSIQHHDETNRQSINLQINCPKYFKNTEKNTLSCAYLVNAINLSLFCYRKITM